MPRWASRGNFVITVGLRPERLQDITEEEAKAEGAEASYVGVVKQGVSYQDTRIASYVKGFSMIWERLNAKRGYSWKTNKWVWRIPFELPC